MDAPHELVKTSTVTPGKGRQSKTEVGTGHMIRAPYTDFDIKRVFFGAPVPGTSKKGGISYFTSKIEYEFLVDGVYKKLPFQIEFPNQPGKRCTSPYGITEVLEFIEKEELELLKKANPDFKQKPTGRHQIMCILPGGTDMTLAFCEVVRQVYAKAVNYMRSHGARGSKTLSKEQTFIPQPGEIGPDNRLDTLRYPLRFGEVVTGKDEDGREITASDLKGEVKIDMAVKIGGKYGVAMKNEDGVDKTYDDLLGLGFEHVPLMIMESLFLGAKNKFRTKMDSSVINRELPPRIMQQGSTLTELRAYSAASSKRTTEEAQAAFEEGGFGDEQSGEPGEPQDDYPEPIATPPTTPISPAKPQVRAGVRTQVPGGSPRVLPRGNAQPR